MEYRAKIIPTYSSYYSEFTKEELLYNFINIPQRYQMNANIFENNEDAHEQKYSE